ncbi:Camkk/camkk-meta protein kinase [Globisporangium polare]
MLELHRLLDAYRDAEEKLGASSAAGAAVPVLDDAAYRLGKYTDGALLRFRGIVHDVQDPELVLLSPGAASDQNALSDDDMIRFADAQVGKDLVERVPLKVALFPHRTEWAQRAYEAGLPKASDGAADTGVSTAMGAGKGTKRTNDDVADVDMSRTETVAAEASVAANGGEKDTLSKKSKATDVAASSDGDVSKQSPFLQNLINVYVYDGQYKDVSLDAFKVNEAFDFIGVLDLLVLGSVKSNNTADATQLLTEDELQRMQISDVFDEIQQRQRTGVVVHCCDAAAISAFHHVRPHHPRHFYTHLQQSNAERKRFCTSEWKKLAPETAAPVELSSVRQQLIEHLAQALDGDVLAAEYLLFCLLSRVYSRPDPTTPLGNLSLNLTLGNTLTTDQVSLKVNRISAVVRSLVPVCTAVDLGLETLNESKFIPHKDYESDAMLSGVLQVPHGTVLLVNETTLSAGQLNDQGVKNVGALQSLVDKMLLPYDFQYYSMDFPQDVAVVSVSEGKSILPVTVSIPIVPAASSSSSEAATESQELIEAFRVFIGVLRTLEVSIGNEQAEIAEKHYVACRQAKQEVSLDDLHRWLRIARLMALSHGEEVVSKAAWDRMLELETKRLDRIQT